MCFSWSRENRLQSFLAPRRCLLTQAPEVSSRRQCGPALWCVAGSVWQHGTVHFKKSSGFSLRLKKNHRGFAKFKWTIERSNSTRCPVAKRALQGSEYCRRRSDKQKPEIGSSWEFCHQQHSNLAYLVLLSARLRGNIADLPSNRAAGFSLSFQSAHASDNTTRDRSRRDFFAGENRYIFLFLRFLLGTNGATVFYCSW